MRLDTGKKTVKAKTSLTNTLIFSHELPEDVEKSLQMLDLGPIMGICSEMTAHMLPAHWADTVTLNPK